jgi:hypothetical protein
MGQLFKPHPGNAWPYIIGAALFSIILFFGLLQLKPRGRKYLIVTITFLAGLYYTLEFFIPVHLVNGSEANFLTKYTTTADDINQVISALALGLGIYSLVTMHGKTILKGRTGSFYSLTFFASMIAMFIISMLVKTPGHEKIPIDNALYNILFKGGLQTLDATMFSIIAFYIVSAAYRAFRIRSAESSLLMGTAFVVMLGQVYAGQVLTSWLPTDGPLANLRVDTLSDWLLTRVNAPAVRAIGFGLGVGLLATSLRIWLSLERGSYFDKEV